MLIHGIANQIMLLVVVVVTGKQTILSINQTTTIVVVMVVLQLIRKGWDQQLKIVVVVCHLEVMMEGVSLVVVRSDDDSFNSIHVVYICIH